MQDYEVRCRACGAPLAPEAAYCGSCGTARAATPAQPQGGSAPSGSVNGSVPQDQAAASSPSIQPEPLAQPASPPAPSMSLPVPNPYGEFAERPAPVPTTNPSPLASEQVSGNASDVPPTPPAYSPAPAIYPSGQYPPPGQYAAPPSYQQPGQYPPPFGYQQSGQYVPTPGDQSSGQVPPNQFPQAAQTPPPGYGPPAYGQPVYFQAQQQSSTGPVIAEVILGLFGIFGVGWLIGGKTTVGAVLLGLSVLWWIVSIVAVVLTFGVGALCIYPIDIAFIAGSAVALHNSLKPR
jgi:hypothetical protein